MSKEDSGPAWILFSNLRAYAAIQLRVPDSGIDWLDEMIRVANDRDEVTIHGETTIVLPKQILKERKK